MLHPVPHLELPMASHIIKYSSLFTGVDAATIQRAAAGLPSNIYNTLAQVAGVTPGITPRVTPGFTPGYTPRPGFTPQVGGSSGGGYSGYRVSICPDRQKVSNFSVKLWIFSYPSVLTFVLGAQKNLLVETVL